MIEDTETLRTPPSDRRDQARRDEAAFDFLVAELADRGLIATDVLECEWAH